MKLYNVQIQPLIDNALREDLGGWGDVTTHATVAPDKMGVGSIVAREDGCIAGLELAAQVFRTLDPDVKVTLAAKDGDVVKQGAQLLKIEGRASTILTGERVALNFLGRMCGIARATRKAADQVKDTRAKVVCTRKTTPGLRTLEKYAVLCGGGGSHRFGLDDGILIKDNHVAFAGGVKNAVRNAREIASHMLKIELEVDNLEQLQEALDLQVDAVLLDNFSLQDLSEGVRMIGGKCVVEASGGITLNNLREVAQTGVDLISMGALTHSARVMDLSLDVVSELAIKA